jgi:predicted nucleic acid-binding protein
VRAGLDTSVVVRLLTGEPEDLAREAMRYVAQRSRAGDRLLVSDLVLAEAYYEQTQGASRIAGGQALDA